jgi:hypothetical protein
MVATQAKSDTITSPNKVKGRWKTSSDYFSPPWMADASETKSPPLTKKKWEPKKLKENDRGSKPITGPKGAADKELTEINALGKVARTSGPSKPAPSTLKQPPREKVEPAYKFALKKFNTEPGKNSAAVVKPPKKRFP